MPKNSSAARREQARALAAAENISYTAALRRLTQARDVRAGWDPIVVDGLTDLVRRGRPIPVRVDGQRPAHAAPKDWGVAEPTQDWGVAEPAVDGYVIRPVSFPNPGNLDDSGVQPGARVPVPYPTSDGGVQVAALWPLVTRRRGDAGWWWVDNGWPVEAPGDLHQPASPAAPSPDLPFEVRVWHQMPGILGEDYAGSASAWTTWGWCADQTAAVELADAAVAHRLNDYEQRRGGRDSGYLRAEVYEHAPDGAEPRGVHRADADPDRPEVPRPPEGWWWPGRPAVEIGPEPTWHPDAHHPPKYELAVWTDAGWRSLGWFEARQFAGIAADMMRIGVNGAPYPWGATIGPRYPRALARDWTQDGRAVSDYHPDMPYAERPAIRRA